MFPMVSAASGFRSFSTFSVPSILQAWQCKAARWKHENERSSGSAANDLPGGGPRRGSSIERDQETAQKDVKLLSLE
jgi:hypothetical protein